MSSCPGDERLVRLLDERLDRREQSDIEHHLEGCDRCQEALEELTRERFSLSEWRPWSDLEHAPTSEGPGPSFDGSSSSFDREGEWAPKPRSDSRVGSSLESGHPATWTSSPGPEPDPAGLPDVAGYEILGRLGQGGMGVVYRARQHGLDRQVALKMIRGGSHAALEHLARFKIEARSVSRLRHPNVVQIFDVGHADGLPYVALELLEGGSLEARVAGTPQPERSSAELLVTLAGAIAAAHRAGVVHRDLKSANVLFAADGTPKVADFGLAKRLDEEDGQTHSGQVMGSPSFMSPEQARGQGREIGPAADLYSLGAILYEMLCGRPPFKGSSAMETLLQVVHDEPVPPSRLRPGLSRDLETICLKCLEKEPTRRYDSAEALADDLRRYLAGSPIRARRVGPRERAWKWARRQPAAASLVGLAMASTIALSIVGVGVYRRERTLERVAEGFRRRAPGVLAVGEVALREGAWDSGRLGLDRFLEEMGKDPRLADVRVDVEGLLGRIEQGQAARREVDEALGRLRDFEHFRRRTQLLDSQIIGSGELGDVLAIREGALRALRVFRLEDLGDGQPPRTLPGVFTEVQATEVKLGSRELLLIWLEAISRPGRGEDPRRQAALAIEGLDRLASKSPATRADRLLRAEFLAKLGDESGAARERQGAELMSASNAFGHVLKGQELYRRHRWGDAIAEFESALSSEPDQFRAQLLLAVCQLQLQHPERALAGLTACLQREKAVGLYLLRGFAYGEEGYRRLKQSREIQGRSDSLRAEAEAQFEAAEADYKTAMTLEPDASEHYGLLVNRGVLRLRRDRVDEAVSDLLRAIELKPDQVTARVTLGQAYRRQGRSDEAVAQFSRGIELKPEMSKLHRSRALARLDRGKPTLEARELAIVDLTESIRLEGPGSTEAAADLARRARLLLIAGRPSEALVDCEAALKALPNDPEALIGRVKALLELKRPDEVVSACDDALSRGKPSAELFELRGLARSHRQEYSGAIQDYTQALALEPGRPVPRIQRGWAYLVSDAPKLALDDFAEAIRTSPDEPDAYSGRGLARAILGEHQLAVKDADDSLTRGPRDDPRTPYNAARVYVRAAASVTANAPRRNLGQLQVANGYLDHAQVLLRTALDRLPPERRAAFWSDVIQADPALASIRQRPKFSQLAGQFGRQAK